MLSIQAGCGDWASILQVFQEAQAYQVTTEDRAMAMLSLSKLGAWPSALDIMGDQLEEPIFLAAMRAWIAGHQWQNVCTLLEDMDDQRASLGTWMSSTRCRRGRSESLFSRAIASCAEEREEKAAAAAAATAAALLRGMRQQKLSPMRQDWNLATGPLASLETQC